MNEISYGDTNDGSTYHANLESVVTPDGAYKSKQLAYTSYGFMSILTGGRGKRVGSTEHDSASLDGVKTLPDHADNRAGHH